VRVFVCQCYICSFSIAPKAPLIFFMLSVTLSVPHNWMDFYEIVYKRNL